MSRNATQQSYYAPFLNQMSDANHSIAMAEYNHWMNQKIYAICAEIPNAKRNEDLGAFFKSINKTRNHILVADIKIT